MKIKQRILTTLSVLIFFSIVYSNTAFAHCDTIDGPVVNSARTALENGDITPVLKWVKPQKEGEINKLFQKTVSMRQKSPEIKEFADTYFFETLVRIHREGEGAPYTGLKPGGSVDAAVAMADKALEDGNIDKLVSVLTNAMANGIRERFQHTRDTQSRADSSVKEGREFVESYVMFTHYVEGLHGLIKGGAAHHGGDAGH